ncbi:hypothetical protein Tco_1516402 [Tanacetum coccineum]
MEIFRQTKLMGLSTDSIPLFVHEENFGHGRMHYYQSLIIGDEYKQDEDDKRGIRHLIRLEKEMMDNKGEVTLYLMRRSLEVLRKFHWMILGGRFNQLLHVSSPLLRKPGEYYFSFGRYLDELHVTWAHLEKKQTRLRTNTNTLEELCSQSLETAPQAIRDAVTTHQVTAGMGEKEFLGNFYMEIPEQRSRSSCGSMLPKGTRKRSWLTHNHRRKESEGYYQNSG